MPGEPKRILIVEDEKPMANALELKLTNAGHNPKAVYNGAEALELLKTEKFDVILLDLVMPEKDGFEVLEELKKQSITTPVIVLSNLGQEEDEKRAKDFGAKDFFIKSDTPIREIVDYVKKQLG